MKRADMKNKSLIFIFATIFVVLTTMIVSAEGNVNVSLVIPNGNGTIYTMFNSSTIELNFTVLNKTTLAGANFTMTVDGALISSAFCNSSTTTPVATAHGNASGCLGWDGTGSATVNKLYLNLSEGKHTVHINVTHGDSLKSSSTNETFYVNNFDSFTWSTGSFANNTNLSSTFFIANVTFNSRVVANITFVLSNYTTVPTYLSSGVAWQNRSDAKQNITNGTGTNGATNAGVTSWSINWSDLVNKQYTYNITIRDINTGYNKTLGRSILLDTVNPTVAYSCSGYYNADTLEVEKGDADFACACVGSDTNDTNPRETIIDPVALSTTGTKGTSCLVTDHAGNNITYGTIIYKVVELSDGTDGGITTGGSSPITGSTYTITAEQLSTGTTKTLSKNDGFKITFRPSAATTTEQHTIKVSAITTTSATIIISSDPITVSMNIGEEKKVDIDGDKTYDVYVKLNAITNGKAEFTVKQISEQIPASEPGPVSGEPTEPTEPETPAKYPSSKTWLWIVLLIVVVAIAGVVYYMMNNKRR